MERHRHPERVICCSDISKTFRNPNVQRYRFLAFFHGARPLRRLDMSNTMIGDDNDAASSSSVRRRSQFRPCIDLHAGVVKQIVGGTLDITRTDVDEGLKTNFVAA